MLIDYEKFSFFQCQFLLLSGNLFWSLAFIASLTEIGTGSIIGFILYGPIICAGFTLIGGFCTTFFVTDVLRFSLTF